MEGLRRKVMTDGLIKDINSKVTCITQYIEYDAPELNIAEMLRYAGFPMDVARKIASGELVDEEINERQKKALDLIKGQLTYKVGYKFIKLEREDGYPVFPFQQHSDNLKNNLENCEYAIMFAATIGSGIDRLIRRYEKTARDMGIFLQGLGAERVESLCDTFNRDVKTIALEAGLKAHARYSPGFGDLPITVQSDFLKTLDAERRMGITLSDSFLMAPSKSVTAITGLEPL